MAAKRSFETIFVYAASQGHCVNKEESVFGTCNVDAEFYGVSDKLSPVML